MKRDHYIDEEIGVVVPIDPKTRLPGMLSLMLVAMKRAEIRRENERQRKWHRRAARFIRQLICRTTDASQREAG